MINGSMCNLMLHKKSQNSKVEPHYYQNDNIFSTINKAFYASYRCCIVLLKLLDECIQVIYIYIDNVGSSPFQAKAIFFHFFVVFQQSI